MDPFVPETIKARTAESSARQFGADRKTRQKRTNRKQREATLVAN